MSFLTRPSGTHSIGLKDRSGRFEDDRRISHEHFVFDGTVSLTAGESDLHQAFLRTEYGLFTDFYSVGEMIGKGTFGSVYKATVVTTRFEKVGGYACVAVKETALSTIDPIDLEQFLNSFRVEKSVMSRTDHPNILKSFGFYTSKEHLRIVTEFCSGGDLFNHIVARSGDDFTKGGFPETSAKHIFIQMLRSVQYLHHLQVVHRDLKSENFLIDGSTDDDAMIVKLCDFGTCAALCKDRPRALGQIGTLSYTAPEVYGDHGAGFAADMWSLGVNLYILVVGASPFRGPLEGFGREDQIRRIKAGNFEQRRESWLGASEPFRGFVRRLLIVPEDRRLICEQALKQPWLATTRRPMLARGLAEPPGLATHACRFQNLLSAFHVLSKSERVALLACAIASGQKHIELSGLPCQDMFAALDWEGHGSVSVRNLTVRLMGVVTADTADTCLYDAMLEKVASIDVNRDGFVGWSDFIAVILVGFSGMAGEVDLVLVASRFLVTSRFFPDFTDRGLEILPGFSNDVLVQIGLVQTLLSVESKAVEFGLGLKCVRGHHADIFAAETSSIWSVGDGILVVARSDSGSGSFFDNWNKLCDSQKKGYKRMHMDDCARVDGCDADKIIGALPGGLKTWGLDLCAVFTPKRFEVCLPLIGDKRPSIGIRVSEGHPGDFGLVIEAVCAGIVERWNEKHPRDDVVKGQIIVAVNGLRGDRNYLLDELHEPSWFFLLLVILDANTVSL